MKKRKKKPRVKLSPFFRRPLNKPLPAQAPACKDKDQIEHPHLQPFTQPRPSPFLTEWDVALWKELNVSVNKMIKKKDSHQWFNLGHCWWSSERRICSRGLWRGWEEDGNTAPCWGSRGTFHSHRDQLQGPSWLKQAQACRLKGEKNTAWGEEETLWDARSGVFRAHSIQVSSWIAEGWSC